MLSYTYLYIGINFLLLGMIVVYFVSSVQEIGLREMKESKPWIAGSVGYLVVIIILLQSQRFYAGLLIFYVYWTLILSLYAYYYIMRKKPFVPNQFYLIILIFATGWILESIQQNYSTLIILMPIVLFQSLVFFFIGMHYLLKEEYNLPMRNFSGILVVILSMVKLLYIMKADDMDLFYVTSFLIDFMIYLYLIYLMVGYDINLHYIKRMKRNQDLNDMFNAIPLNFMTLDIKGNIITFDEAFEDFIKQMFHNQKNLKNICQIQELPFGLYWKDILEKVRIGEKYSMEVILPDGSFEVEQEFVFMPYTLDKEGNENSISETLLVCAVLEKKRKHLHMSSFGNFKSHVLDRYILEDYFSQIILRMNNGSEVAIGAIYIGNFENLLQDKNYESMEALEKWVVERLYKAQTIQRIHKVSSGMFEFIAVAKNRSYSAKEELIEIGHEFKDRFSFLTIPEFYLGLSIFPEHGENYRELSDKAKLSLLDCLVNQDITYVKYSDEIYHRLFEEELLCSRIRLGIEREEFFLKFQPIHSLRTGEIICNEALIRWNAKEGMTLLPAQFLKFIEQMECMKVLDLWVFRQSVDEAIKWQSIQKRPSYVAMNISLIFLKQDNMSQLVKDYFNATGFSPENVYFEVSEMDLVRMSEHELDQLRSIRQLGSKLVLDDFGSGNSDIEMIQSLPFSILKIDHTLLEDLKGKANDIAHIQGVIQLAKNLDMRVVAEGVESERQVELLKRSGCDYAQGHALTLPLEKGEIMALMI